MGQVLGKSKEEANYYAPQVLKGLENIDLKRLKKLIRKKHLAPCYPGVQEPKADQVDLEECPICFLHFPALNTSECCSQRICTECILKVQVAAIDPWPCPFCKKPDYTVKFTGPKTKEEKEKELIEHQKVLEARARERQDEIVRDQQREFERLQARQASANNTDSAAATASTAPTDAPLPDVSATASARALPAEASGTAQEQQASAAVVAPRDSLRHPYTLEAFLPATLSNMVDNLDQLNDYMLELALCNSALEAGEPIATDNQPATRAAAAAAADAPDTESSHMQEQLAVLPAASSAASSTHTSQTLQQAYAPSQIHPEASPSSSGHIQGSLTQSAGSVSCATTSASLLPGLPAASTSVPGQLSYQQHPPPSSHPTVSPSPSPPSPPKSAGACADTTVPLHQLVARAAAAGEPPGSEKVRILAMLSVSAEQTTQPDAGTCTMGSAPSQTGETPVPRNPPLPADSATAGAASCSQSLAELQAGEPVPAASAASASMEGAGDQTTNEQGPPSGSPPAAVSPLTHRKGRLVATVLDDPKAPAWQIHPIVIENPDATFFVDIPSHPMAQWETIVSMYSTSEDARLMAAIAGVDQAVTQRIGTSLGASGGGEEQVAGGAASEGHVQAALGEGSSAPAFPREREVPVAVPSGHGRAENVEGGNAAVRSAADGVVGTAAISHQAQQASADAAASDSGGAGSAAGELDFMERLRRADAAYAAAIAKVDQQFTSSAFPPSTSES